MSDEDDVVEQVMMSLDELQHICRFCLKPQSRMRELQPDALRNSDIPEMFEMVTGYQVNCSLQYKRGVVKTRFLAIVILYVFLYQMTISSDYSPQICSNCESNMRSVRHIRDEFRSSDQFWRSVLTTCEERVALKSPPAEFQLEVEIEPNDEGTFLVRVKGDAMKKSTVVEENHEIDEPIEDYTGDVDQISIEEEHFNTVEVNEETDDEAIVVRLASGKQNFNICLRMSKNQ